MNKYFQKGWKKNCNNYTGIFLPCTDYKHSKKTNLHHKPKEYFQINGMNFQKNYQGKIPPVSPILFSMYGWMKQIKRYRCGQEKDCKFIVCWCSCIIRRNRWWFKINNLITLIMNNLIWKYLIIDWNRNRNCNKLRWQRKVGKLKVDICIYK
jgi:hypothetical protein